MAKKKTRVDLRKNRAKPPRENTWTSGFREHGYEEDATVADERVRAKGDISRKRTIIEEVPDNPGEQTQTTLMPAIDESVCLQGRVIRIHGLQSIVEAKDGRIFKCSVRGLLKNLQTDERSVVTTGDRVWFLVSGGDEGVIERVEPRFGVLTRESRRREHVLVANVDQLVIVMSLVEPDLKPHLIDRYLASAQTGKLAPILCLNKADLVEHANLQSMIGSYAQLGIPTLLTSVRTGQGIPQLRELLADRSTVFSGQSGVGKSSLLNAIQPGLALRVSTVSDVNQKGRHTTTTAELIRLETGGWVVDTPGVRQLQLWDIRPEEIEGFFPEFRAFVPGCSFPDCTHTHEAGCAIKRAVVRRQISVRRFHSYIGMRNGMAETA
ncbi:ribosome small subunit-dependent GTPase A [Zavarzinella formosa]|uniref:ribosome small subunit-dependent GTPase A n=1 Tax=Zavarzinella formosa TaxID=360055 RepID=UPI000301975A|nr:ribosome small subunit-dependent GTPase A [Zavarzinella formosa]